MSLNSRTRTAKRLLGSKEYRDAYVLEHIKNGVAFQIRTLREDRGWTQGKLGELARKPRNVISRLEDPNYGKFTLATLLEIASAFDVGLLVKFVPLSRLTREYDDVSPEALTAKSVTDKKEIAALNAWALEGVAVPQNEDTTQGASTLQLYASQAATVQPSVNTLATPHWKRYDKAANRLSNGGSHLAGSAPDLLVSTVFNDYKNMAKQLAIAK